MKNDKEKNNKFHIKKGDFVKNIAGNDKGKTGRVLAIDTQKKRAVVEGMNIRTFHKKPTKKQPKGKREKKEAALEMSSLMLLIPETQVPTRVGRKKDDSGKLRRYAKKTGNFI